MAKQVKKYELKTVKVSNDWNALCYPKITATEMNLMGVILSKASEEKNAETVRNGVLTISKEEVLRSFEYSDATIKRHWSDEEFEKFIGDCNKGFMSKMKNLCIYKNNKKSTGFINVIDQMNCNKDVSVRENSSPVLEVVFGKSASQFLLDLGESNPFYKYNLAEFIKIKSPHAKHLWQFYCQWKSVGKFTLKIDEVREYFGVLNYRPNDITTLLKRTTEELKQIVPSFKMKPLRDGQKKNAIVGYQFTFDTKVDKKEQPPKIEKRKRVEFKGIEEEDHIKVDKTAEDIDKELAEILQYRKELEEELPF